MKVDIPRLVIAAPHSGSGKSIIATGLMAVFSGANVVQGFKVGPDYIDPGYHTQATGHVSRNLDTWMVPREQMQATFARASRGADIAIIEGVMGLFDGFNAKTEEGSTAQVAKLLKAPVILVIDVGKMARSAGAMALGYQAFDPDLNLAGVICNRVGSEKHARWVTEAIESVGIPVLGCIPKSKNLKTPERHLGLHMAEERSDEVEKLIETSSKLFRKHIDLERIWHLASTAEPLEIDLPSILKPILPRTRIAVARDEAFCFYYEDNLDFLRQMGAEIVFFSPLRDSGLPEGTTGIYLGGGYPELYAVQLAENVSMRQVIAEARQNDMPLYAECGGLMVLTRFLVDLEGKRHEMMGLLPGHAEMVDRLVMGYREMIALQDTLLMKKGSVARGHEFHYSNWMRTEEENSPAYDIKPRVGEVFKKEGYVAGNLLASYIHIHFASNPDLAKTFVDRCHQWQESKTRA